MIIALCMRSEKAMSARLFLELKQYNQRNILYPIQMQLKCSN